MTFTPPTVEVRADPAATDSVQPVSMSDMLSGSVLESAPLEGDDFQSLLPMLPGVIRDAEGRLRIKGGQPSQGALQVSAASLVDPSTGDFDLDLPGQSVESVEVLANPFAAEYGRFSTSVTQVRTRRGTNVWELKYGNYIPRFKGLFNSIRGFEPRFGLHGPLVKNRVFLAQDIQYRYVATPVRSLPDEPEIKLTSFDSFTRLDIVASARHTLGGGAHPVSTQDQTRHAEHVPADRDDTRVQPEWSVDRLRRPLRPRSRRGARNDGGLSQVRGERQHREHREHGVHAGDAGGRLLQRSGTQRHEPAMGGVVEPGA